MIWIFILAFSLRLINLNQSLWLDEAIQVLAVKNLSLSQLFSHYLPTDFNPPLMYLIHYFWGRLFGYSEIAMRLPSVIFGALTVVVVFKLAQALKPKSTLIPVTASLLLATSPLHLYYSQEARAYSLATLLVTLSFYFFWRLIKNNNYFLAYTITLVATLLTHYLTWLILPAQLLAIIFIQPRKFKDVFKAQILALVLLVPWFPTMIKQLNLGQTVVQTTPVWTQIVGGANLKSLLLIPVKFLIGRLSIDNNHLFALVLAWPLLMLTTVVLTAIYHFDDHKKAFILLWSWLLTPLILAFFISLQLPLLAYFRFLFLLPAFYLLIAFALSSFKSLTTLLLGCFMIINLTAIGFYFFNPRFQREDWRALSQALVEQNQTNSPVIIISVVSAPLNYYSDQFKLVDYLDIDDYQNNQQLWLIPYAEPIFYPSFSGRDHLSRQGFKLKVHQTFNGGLELLKYTK